MCAFTGEGRGVIHLLVDDDQAGTARRALEEADMGVVDEREALVIDVEDRPGTLGELARSLGEVSVNIELAYTTFGGVKLVIVTDDIDNARAALRLGTDALALELGAHDPATSLANASNAADVALARPRRSGRARASTPPPRPGVMKMPWFMW